MILCHKCAGVLAYEKIEDTTGLRSCECMSGYVRGFEPIVDRATSIVKQAEQQERWAQLYERQGRDVSQIHERRNERNRLLSLR